MNKITILIFGLLLTLQSFGQEPELFRTWYLYEIQSTDLNDLYIVSEIDPPIQPFITILETLEFNGEGACNTFSGNYMLLPNDELSSEDFTSTNENCDIQIHTSFERDYFDFMRQFYYTIISDSNGLNLYLENALFGHAIFKDYPLSISENETVAFKIYPNPVSEQLFIISEKSSVDKITVFSVTGEKIIEQTNVENSIDVSSLSQGMYFLEIESAEGRSVRKFIKN